MRTKKGLSEELESAITSGHSLGQIDSLLRDLRDAGVSRHEAREALETLRARALDEATEDRILEVMDIVSGFCNSEISVWRD